MESYPALVEPAEVYAREELQAISALARAGVGASVAPVAAETAAPSSTAAPTPATPNREDRITTESMERGHF